MDNELAIRIAALAAASQAVSEYASVIHRAELYATWLRKRLDEGSEELAQAETALVTNPRAYGAQAAVQGACDVCHHTHVKERMCAHAQPPFTQQPCRCMALPNAVMM